MNDDERERSCGVLIEVYYLRICVEGLRKTAKSDINDIRYRSRDSKFRASPLDKSL
jgi:hypothetical protein